LNSLDPRVNRLSPEVNQELTAKSPLDQLGTFEVFVKPKEGKPFQHEGAVHATEPEMAFVLAKENFTRRFMCVSLFVVDTRSVFVSHYTDDNHSVYDDVKANSSDGAGSHSFEIFHLLKRGKQHVHAGQVLAKDYADAITQAKKTVAISGPVYNLWVIRSEDIRFTTDEEKDFWLTLPEKKFRDASDYKAGDKLKLFLEKN
jgi:ring-1,2-phenylacetyl-CoA epoxidase subunit PaaB